MIASKASTSSRRPGVSSVVWKAWSPAVGAVPSWREQPAQLHLLRIEPDPHGVLPGAEDVDGADARQPRNLVQQVQRREIGQEQAVMPRPVGGQRDDLEDRGRALVGLHALRLDDGGQLRQRRRDPVLHQDLRLVGIGPDPEGHGQRVEPVAGAGRGHVDHVLDAVDLLLDRQRDLARDHGRAGAGIAGADLHRRRHDIGILRHRQPQQRHQPEDDGQDRDDIRQDRPLDEEPGHQRAALPASATGRTRLPGMAFCIMPTTTRSAASRPARTTRRPPSLASPTSTARCSTWS